MAKIDLKPLSLSDLRSLHKRIETAIARHEKKSKAAALAEVRKEAKSLGFALDELVGDQAPGKATAKRSAKKAPLPAAYRDPADTNNTWSGRGRRPAWVVAAFEAGRSLDDLKI